MTMTIGFWVAPVLVTITSILIAFWKAPNSKSDGVFAVFGDAVHLGLNLLAALVVSLISWVTFVVYLYY